jgi:hypothetical protein
MGLTEIQRVTKHFILIAGYRLNACLPEWLILFRQLLLKRGRMIAKVPHLQLSSQSPFLPKHLMHQQTNSPARTLRHYCDSTMTRLKLKVPFFSSHFWDVVQIELEI